MERYLPLSAFLAGMFSFYPDHKRETVYKKEVAKARRWNELVVKHGNKRKKILEIMSKEGYNVLNYKSSVEDDESA